MEKRTVVEDASSGPPLLPRSLSGRRTLTHKKERTAKSRKEDSDMKGYVVTGIVTLVMWLALFAGGLTIDSSPYRAVFTVPRSVAVEESTVPISAQPAAATISSAIPLTAFLAVVAFYTPLNVALLTLLAGLAGGCASRLTYAKSHPEGLPQTANAKNDPSTMFRTEHPVASMLRCFLVYLAFIAGVFITTNDPFADTTPSQYVRIAGLLSFVSFVVGYDPTRFQEILSLKPAGEGK